MATFFELEPEFCDPNTALFHIQPIPYEGTVCFLHGTAAGPEAILAVSDQMEHFDEETFQEYVRAGVATHPPIPAAETPEEQMRRIYDTVVRRDFFCDGKFPIFLGGEHGITAPIVRAAREKHPDALSVLQFDAHADLRHAYTGGTFSHASVMRRVTEIVPSVVQVGIRSISPEEYEQYPEHVRRFVTPGEIEEDFAFAMDRILFMLQKKVYVTVDIDVFDPSQAPGVGTPEPGGLTWRNVTAILRHVFRNRTVIGADVVETLPLGGGNVTTEFLAARLVGKLMAYHYANVSAPE